MSLEPFLDLLPLLSESSASRPARLAMADGMRAAPRLQHLEMAQRCHSASAGVSLTGHVNWKRTACCQQIPWASTRIL